MNGLEPNKIIQHFNDTFEQNNIKSHKKTPNNTIVQNTNGKYIKNKNKNINKKLVLD